MRLPALSLLPRLPAPGPAGRGDPPPKTPVEAALDRGEDCEDEDQGEGEVSLEAEETLVVGDDVLLEGRDRRGERDRAREDRRPVPREVHGGDPEGVLPLPDRDDDGPAGRRVRPHDDPVPAARRAEV